MENNGINKDLEESREERLEKIKKDLKDAPSGRPMSYIYPKRIQSILNGETPVISVSGFQEKKYEEPRKIGERWTDENGKEWEQKDGYKMSIKKIDLSMFSMPSVCPKCHSDMYTNEEKLNRKFWNMRNHCFGCQLRLEQKINSKELWKAYEESIMIPNAISYLKDVVQQMKEYRETLNSPITYVNEDGKVETWSAQISKLKEFIDLEITKAESDIVSLENDLIEVKQLIDPILEDLNRNL